jgi:DNA-binding transcriptional ArsR family regulator
MIALRVGRPSDLLAVRFATSPVWETVLAARSYGRGSGGSARRRVPLPRERVDLSTLLAVNPRRGYTPDFLTPPPEAPAPRFASQLAAVRRTPLDRVEAELVRCRAVVGGDDAATVDRLLADPAAARAELADAIERAWQGLVAPTWPRLRSLLSADVAFRSRQLAEQGLRRVIDGLDERIGWDGAAIVLDVPGDDVVDVDERGIVLMPSAYAWPNVTAVVDPPWQPTVIYPARGIGRLWQSPPEPGAALARLLGVTRARILLALDVPASTTNLASRLGLSASGASRHLTALRDAGLLDATRHGHEVRYGRTRLGSALLRGGAVA